MYSGIKKLSLSFYITYIIITEVIVKKNSVGRPKLYEVPVPVRFCSDDINSAMRHANTLTGGNLQEYIRQAVRQLNAKCAKATR